MYMMMSNSWDLPFDLLYMQIHIFDGTLIKNICFSSDFSFKIDNACSVKCFLNLGKNELMKGYSDFILYTNFDLYNIYSKLYSNYLMYPNYEFHAVVYMDIINYDEFLYYALWFKILYINMHSSWIKNTENRKVTAQ